MLQFSGEKGNKEREAAVFPPRGEKALAKLKKKQKPKVRADEPLHAEEAKEKGKINKYGFLHVDKDLAKHLGVVTVSEKHGITAFG